jgi:hypothetical protein
LNSILEDFCRGSQYYGTFRFKATTSLEDIFLVL